VEEELERVGMGGWLNFSSDHVEPIKADHGTQPPPPTSSTFFVLSLFPPRVLAFIHPLSALPPSLTRTRESVLFLGCALFRLVPARTSRNPSFTPFPGTARSSFHPLVFLLLPSFTHSLSSNSLDFFASRGGVIYLAEVERHPRGGGRRNERGLGRRDESYEGGISRENRWRRQR